MTTTATAPDLTSPQTRAAVVDQLEDDGRYGAILLRAVPLDLETEIWDGWSEKFMPGCFDRQARSPHRVKLRMEHDGPVIGVGTDVVERDGAIWCRFRFANTLAAQEARGMVIDEVLDQCSITFVPVSDWTRITTDGDGGVHVEYARATLLDVSLVATGAYGDEAYIASVRGHVDAAAARAVEEDRREAARVEALARLMRLVS